MCTKWSLAIFQRSHLNINAVMPLLGPNGPYRRPVTRSTLSGVKPMAATRTTTAKAFKIPGVVLTVVYLVCILYKSNILPIQVTVEQSSG